MHDLHEISQDVIRRGSGDLNFNDIASCKEFCESIATDHYAALQFNPDIGCECIFIEDTIPVTPQLTESFKISSGWIRPSVAWYKSGTFDLKNEIWPNALDGQRDGAFLNGTLGIASLSGHGATRKVTALHGSTSASINFGDIIKDRFTICSVTRYRDGVKNQILSSGLNWIHGHWNGKAGVARYGTVAWHTHTDTADTVEPNTNWVVMCGTNAGSQLKLVNGVDKSNNNNNNNNGGGEGDAELMVNEDEKSDFAIAEVMVWDRGLTSDEMDGVSDYLMNKFGIAPGESAANPVVDLIVRSSTRVDLLSNREVFCQDGLECIAILPSVEMDELQDGWTYLPVKDKCVSRIVLLPPLPISRPCSHNQTKHKNDSLQRDT